MKFIKEKYKGKLVPFQQMIDDKIFLKWHNFTESYPERSHYVLVQKSSDGITVLDIARYDDIDAKWWDAYAGRLKNVVRWAYMDYFLSLPIDNCTVYFKDISFKKEKDE